MTLSFFNLQLKTGKNINYRYTLQGNGPISHHWKKENHHRPKIASWKGICWVTRRISFVHSCDFYSQFPISLASETAGHPPWRRKRLFFDAVVFLEWSRFGIETMNVLLVKQQMQLPCLVPKFETMSWLFCEWWVLWCFNTWVLLFS